MSGPSIGDVWVTRIFRDDSLRLRVFKLVSFMNLSIGVVDMEDIKNKVGGIEHVIWYAKGDLQFFDLIQEGKAAYEEVGEENKGSGGSNPAAGSSGKPGNDAGVRQKRNG